MICYIATKSNARKKTNATDTGLVKRLRTQTFSMQVSTIPKNLLLMVARITSIKIILIDMTQEEKQLLLKDLSARLPYGVICYNSNTENNFKLCDTADIDSGYPTFDYGYGELETVKPYLRPMSSMTEEEKEELIKNFWGSHTAKDTFEELSWYLSKHFDINELIPRGLAIEVTEENNPYKE